MFQNCFKNLVTSQNVIATFEGTYIQTLPLSRGCHAECEASNHKDRNF